MANPSLLERLLAGNLVKQIIIAMVLGVLVAQFAPELAVKASVLGDFFVRALKAVAPLLVFILVLSAITNQSISAGSKMRPVIALYLGGTFAAAMVAVIASFAFPTELTLVVADVSTTPPSGIAEVMRTLLFKLVDNPVNALQQGNFIGLLAWAVILGFALRHSADSTKTLVADLADAVSMAVRLVIHLAPIGIFGLVANTVAVTGLEALLGYSHLLAVLIGSMLLVALVVNPLLVLIKTGRNPYPLVFLCLRESGITAFFTRSSAANIPVNMALCERLNLNKDLYSVSIPLGATINMAGAAITITVLTLAAVHTLGVQVDIATAILLSIVAAISACGASGVAGGSLLLIPMACNLFGIANEVALQVVAVGFIIGVIQDSAETALNSSTDVLFTAACAGVESAAEEAAEAGTKEVNAQA